ncbi:MULTISPECIES: zinc ABC transporter ATP-binding protein ZnuC [Pasteurellaceae]|uniref:Zinc ABC transporter ATP-binding protein ZnuC n=3 Tax=Pasteurellaceae TaxID=712 RepID=A0AAQ4LX28_9PAST|nr:zinc ABC transporter ATP-binding protein ZnuC [Pasteurella atlantica]MBR0573266.1 zinc ABC transporter ATP-binding protein ZnuC [Pasteurella atlantica]MDP8039118.1 zinc ABC transporter ATP-binding protein ZnuC [Pasteurella atlantica]MDP8041283.1 zinc ABC transporter ATP-binding protein ZnuC [Pasteurella atlantica]MDP8043420.1 zinc ABC transporter ATP-binding protein ZnuC [Pasteurella atlantica]MDP8045506.1 zinc ABC transporter ATP-binding protein ZnuC [Pasteurella atlantica]
MTKITPLISLKNINVYFNAQHILQNIHLDIYPNTITTIVGPNGGGKSTLLKVLLKLLSPNSGEVIHVKGLKIGYVPQKLHIENSMPISVERFLALKPQCTKVMIQEVLTLFSINHLAKNSLQKLSGGEMQRVLLARAMLNKPQLLVLDEPMQGVDITGQAELYQLLNKMRSMLNCAILMVSHDLNIVMANTDEVLCINHHICCSGTPEKITNDPKFIDFFGDQFAKNIAVYSHHHNHHHDLHGDVCTDCHCKN